MLTPRPNQRRVTLDRPAVVKELFRTPEALPGLRGGPYEFSLTWMTFAAGRPASPPYYRSGAALDYVLAGAATVTADGKTARTPADEPLFERYSWVHRLANPGDEALVLLQANISREGESPVHVVPER
jgi:mannose-6-phosphate isomerase-like protein (cupin superfamily)